jgi:predicted DNA-binding protein YlxM (UPF0122 family)
MKKLHQNISKKGLAQKQNAIIEVLSQRVSLLTGKNKVLMTMYLKNGNTFYQMAKLSGVDQSTIARRIYRLSNRLINGQYIECLKNRQLFTAVEMNIAKDYYLDGLSIKRITAKRSFSFYRVRKMLVKIEGALRTVRIEDSKIQMKRSA